MDQDGTDLKLESTNASKIEIQQLREELEQAKKAVIVAVEASNEANKQQFENIRILEEREIRAHQEVERYKREINQLKSELKRRSIKIDNQENGRIESDDSDGNENQEESGVTTPTSRDSQIEELRKQLEHAMWEVEHRKTKQPEKTKRNSIIDTGETEVTTYADASTEIIPTKKTRWSKIGKKVLRAWCM